MNREKADLDQSGEKHVVFPAVSRVVHSPEEGKILNGVKITKQVIFY